MRPEHWIYTIPLRLRSLFQRKRADQELSEELAHHLDRKTESYLARGMSPDQAKRAAVLEMDGLEKVKEECREQRRVTAFQDFAQDFRYSFRMLRKSPGFAAVVALTLALGIGANTAVFSVVYAVLLRPLPYPHSQELVDLEEKNEHAAVKERGCSYQDIQALRESGAFADVAGAVRHQLTLTGSGDPTTVTTVVVTPAIFSVLQVSPILGRFLLTEDDHQGAAPAVVLSEGLWRSRFGGNPDIVGTAVNLDQRAFTVVGVMPTDFRVPVFGPRQDIWIPAVADPVFGPLIPARGLRMFVLARMNPGISLVRTQAQADAVSASLAKDFPAENQGWEIRLSPLQQDIAGDMRTPLLILLAAVGFLLLLACINIANLLLARATSRTREIAVRQALGAARGRIIRQLLTEAAVLGSLGAAIGVAMAYAGVRVLRMFLPTTLPNVQNLQIDGWVLGFALLLSGIAVMGFGLAPSLLAASSHIQRNLKDSVAQSGSSGGRLKLRGFLAGAEIALATVLVIASGLLVRSLMAMTSVNPGFETAHTLKAEVSLPRYQYSKPQQWAVFSDTLLERLHAQPGLKDSAFGGPLPVVDAGVNLKFSIADHPALPPGMPGTADWVSTSPSYFQVMGIPLLRGRAFSDDDSSSSLPVTIISESFARQYFQNENPIGQKLVFSFLLYPNMPHEIVGVVGDVRDNKLTKQPGPMMYVPFVQEPLWGGMVVVKSTLAPSAIVGSIRQVVHSIDKNLPLTDVATMPEIIQESVAQPKFRGWLLGLFGVVALLLAAAGVFGVVSYSVTSRSRELGVRAALGASPGLIGKMILSETLVLAVGGLLAGLAGSFGLVRFLRSELYGIGTYDPATFLVCSAILLSVALLASLVPAWRATRVDPMITLRCE